MPRDCGSSSHRSTRRRRSPRPSRRSRRSWAGAPRVRSAVGAFVGTARSARASADLWAARVGEHLADVETFGRTLLSTEEQRRLAAYRSRESAERYVVTRALVRLVLG